tara:strand:+ start:1012 stop:1500 length:489 start_codon:yes stop_codon:yes gene_type:complete
VINQTQIKEIIKETLYLMKGKYLSQDAVDFVYEIGLVESRYEYLKQLGDGPAKSFWQVEVSSCLDNIQNYIAYRKHLIERFSFASNLHESYWVNTDEDTWDWILTTNIAAAIIHCRLKLWRIPLPLPSTLEERAAFWKKHYNTEMGKGTEAHYIELIQKYDN